MKTAVMMEPIAESSPRFKAQIAGVFDSLTRLKQLSGQHGPNSTPRRTHGTPD
jgi:hypothetical protein